MPSKRSIPAPAGEPRQTKFNRPMTRVYPRACGGTLPSTNAPLAAMGLSPRLRGNLSLAGSRGARCGSIPAPAGEPIKHHPLLKPVKVYPRACGGTVRKP